MIDRRKRNMDWAVVTEDGCYMPEEFYPYASLAVLMDIRKELQTLNRVFACRNFQRVPFVLDAIAKHTKPKPRRKVKR